MLAKLYSFLAVVISALYFVPSARPYVATLATVLGGVTIICTSLAALPGRVGQFFAALGHDLDAAIAAIPKPPTGKGPPGVVAGALMLVGVAAVGCGGHLPPVAQIVIDAGCVASHYDELATAEGQGAAAFLVAIERVARGCGIERDIVVTIFGTHKAQRARGMALPAPACSSAVRP